ncbi:tRNA (adenosine(37)-N6)-dimethylallyltransferase MiaA [Patescibacteria group bacterium]|nr:tRNA (adenosine(37)-N6)-dimethylallyltransferase MiaA [Patescibacteria group bacterium]MBU4000373.1 tRNA (adenosine(37)-N6)-dimethylallyltransferase MiaA [Patescibacteria group bacterium]MBU4056456.1 tRNA (adenosine(37)-N6)-dimethylallyltransferase MiaA [Patescibacteria group bacterium]MBU4368836.1 tRNA (adenosine(37)-N6)-dimethylallyltransferase MiaA [Patescibacteria group bacterium]
MSSVKPLIVILGPTASGKSELALRLAKKCNGEIISADSRQIYREMDIGTAKPFQCQKSKVKSQKYNSKFKNNKLKPILIQNIPHYLIDIINPDEEFSVAQYKELAIKIIRDIQSRGKIPFLVGGTGLYVSAMVDNLEIPKVKPNLSLRKKLEKMPLDKLLKKLEKLDPMTLKIIDKKNKRRIIRALEVTISTKKPFSKQREKGRPLFDVLEIGIDVPRKALYKKIDQRVNKMIKQGLVDETKKFAKKYSWKLPSMSGIGYKQIGMYLRGEITLEKAGELIKFATHAYARRQMTWFRRDKRIKWIKMDTDSNFNKIIKLCKMFLQTK